MVSNSQRTRIIISFVLFFFPGRHHLLLTQYLVTHVFLTDKTPYLFVTRTQPQRGYMTFHLPWKLGVLIEVEAGDARRMIGGKDLPPSSKKHEAWPSPPASRLPFGWLGTSSEGFASLLPSGAPALALFGVLSGAIPPWKHAWLVGAGMRDSGAA